MKKIITFLLLFFACLTLLFGAWFETNGVLFKYFNVFNLSLHNKQLDFVSISFGLWNYCAWNTQFIACSPIQMNYDIGKSIIMVLL